MFLGQLREAEVERLYERTKDAIMETCLAMTIFREEFNVKFVVMFVSLLFVKIFHWLCGRAGTLLHFSDQRKHFLWDELGGVSVTKRLRVSCKGD